MTASLETTAGKTEPARLALTETLLHQGVLLGRGTDADVRILDETASRRHARITEADGRVTLTDLGSANGTRLNDERVTKPAALFEGDIISIGGVRLRFHARAVSERETVVPGADAEVQAAIDPEQADPAGQALDQDVARRLRLVCESATALADAADAREVPTLLLDLLGEALAFDKATVSLVVGRGQPEVVAAVPQGSRPPTSSTVRRRVLEEGEAVLVRDGHDPATVSNPSIARSRFRSTLVAPLKAGDAILGALALEATRAGAFTPSDLTAVAAVARQGALALRNLRALSTARATAASLARAGEGGAPDLVGTSPQIAQVRARIAKAATADAPVLIVGETGTGKELVARHLHAQSARHMHPFVAINCAALVEGLVESEFFGHEQGAFTGATQRREGRIAQAGEGTLFLDEVGELPASMQAKLLRVLSERTYTRVGGHETLAVRCRIVCATNRDLQAMVAAGTFREDLYYRLAVVVAPVPALRERDGDLDVLTAFGLERLAAQLGRRTPRLADDAREALAGHRWPGNVRELLNLLERVLVLLDGDTITADDLPAEVRQGRARPGSAQAPDVLTLREAERRAVEAALHHTGGRKGDAAALLGIAWPTLNRKIREYGIELPS